VSHPRHQPSESRQLLGLHETVLSGAQVISPAPHEAERPDRSPPPRPPERCPFCNTPTVKAEGAVFTRCPNLECPERNRQIVTAFAYFDLYSRIGLRGSLTAVAVAVAVTSFPFMLWTVLAAIEDTDPNVVPAAATLGADPVEQFLFVRLPLLAPGIVTGALVVFVLSITDFVVSQVLTNIDNQTLPVYVYSGLRGAISPALGAVSAFFIAVVALAFAAVLRLGKVERFLFRT